MKLKLLFFFLMASVVGWGQTTIFSENMGTTATGTTPIASNIFENSGIFSYVGTADVRITAPSNSYSGASGGSNIFFTNISGRYFTIYNINTLGYSNITLNLGLAKSTGNSTSLSSSQFVIEFATDYNSTTNTGTFTSLSFSNISTGANVWSLVSTIGTIPASSNLAIRFRQNHISSQVRIDDVKLVGDLPSCTSPTTQATSFTSSTITQTSATVGWTRGDGNNVLVVARQGSVVNADPANGTSYTASANFGSGDEIGTGNYVVYNGTGDTVDLTGLTPGTNYYFAVYEYHTTDTCYNLVELTGNLTTQEAPSLTTSTTLLNFGQTCFGSSEEMSFTISGTNLEAGEIFLSSNPNYTYSETSGGSSISSFTHLAGNLSPKTIYVTLTPSAAEQSNNGTIEITSTNNTPVINVGLISNSYSSVSLTTSDATNITNNSATLNGNISLINECHTVTERGFIYSKTSDDSNPLYDEVNGTTVFKIVVSGLGLGNFSAPISGLEPDTEYTFTSYLLNDNGMVWESHRTFSTLGNATHLAFNPAPPATAAVGVNLTTFRVEARRADNTIDTNFTGPITISKASGGGNMTGTVTVNAIAGIATFNNIQFDDAGTHTIAANHGSFTTLISGNIVVSYVSSYTDYFRSKPGTGNWNSPSTWESSPNGLNGWINATVYPDEEAGGVLIPVGSTVNVSSSGIYITNTNVNGILKIDTPGANPFTITGDTDYELIIENGGILDVSSEGYPSYASDSYILIKSGGKIIANPGIDTEYFLNDYLDYYGVMVFEHDAIAEWNVPAYPPSRNDLDWEIYNDDIIYPIDDTAVPIFRISNLNSDPNYSYGNFTNDNYIYAKLEINTPIPFNIDRSKNKYFMGGISGNGVVNILNTSGDIILGNNFIKPELGGNITLSIPTTNIRLKLNNGANVPEGSNFIIQSNNNTQNRSIQRTSGDINIEGILDITNIRITNSSTGSIQVNETGKIRTRHTEGLFGVNAAIIEFESNKLQLNDNSTVEYYANSNQVVSTGLDYQNLLITGSGVKTTAHGDLIVNGMTSIKSADAVLRVPRPGNIPDATPIPLDTTPNVFYALGGIDNTNGTTGKFVLSSDANLIQHNDSRNNADNSKASIVVERYVHDMDANNPVTTPVLWDYVYWSSPIKNHALRPFSPGTQTNRFYEYRESNNFFYNAPENVFYDAKGYAIRAEGTEGFTYNKTYEFKGEPNNANSYVSPILKMENNGYNLVGNPYPSNIDLDALFSTNSSNIHSVAYFWTNNTPTYYQSGASYVSNSYAIYNGTGGVPATTNATDGTTDYNVTATPDGFAKVGQGFIVKAKTHNVAGLTFNTNMRAGGNDMFFHRQVKNRFWINLSSPSQIVNTILVGYIPGATNEYEQDFDTNLMTVGSDAIYSILGTRKLAIQGKEDNFQVTDVIPIGVKFFELGKYTIDIPTREGLFETQKIYLKDKYRGNSIHDFTNGGYTFKAGPGEFKDRFEIIFKRRNISISSQASLHALADGKINIIKENDYISISSSNSLLKKVEIFNLSGRSIYQNQNINQTQLQIPAGIFGKEILIVNVETSEGEIVSKKLINN